MRTIKYLFLVSCLGVLSACTLFVEVKDPPANNANNTNNATCGDGTRNGTEECDLQDLGGATCVDLGLGDGVLACNDACRFDTSGCGGSLCGDGQVSGGEDCDEANLNGYTCLNLDFQGGFLTCDDDCHFDSSQCSETPVCGDGLRGDTEPCDGGDLGGATCESLNMGFTGGTLQCAGDCTFDTSGCNTGGPETNCENDWDDDNDGFTDCEDSDCSTWPNCMVFQEICDNQMDDDGDGKFDCADEECAVQAICQGGFCQDGAVNASEQCDGANLNGQTCQSLGYTSGGILLCDAACNFDVSGCQGGVCGDDQVNGSEQCDGTNLNGQTCESQGYPGGGILLCDPSCNIDLTNCIGYVTCGNGVIDPSEGEDCDGTNLQGYGCADFGFLSGTTLGCDAVSCLFDFSACVYNNTMPARELVSSSGAHTCAASSATVRCWGYNLFRQLGDVTPYMYRPTPGQAVKYSTYNLGASAIATGNMHTCAVAANSTIVGRVVCWGENQSGQLGIGTLSPQEMPTLAGTLTNVTALAAGGEHTCAVTSGQVYCWGSNWHGQLGVGSTNNEFATPTSNSTLSNYVTDLSAGAQHTCAVRTQTAGQGQLYCWGRNDSGQVGNNSTTTAPSPVLISSLTNVQRVACGAEHTCAIAGGNVYCWGSNSHGQLGISGGNRLSPQALAGQTAFKIMAGGNNTCIIQGTTGPVSCWGDNQYGQLGQGDNNVYTGPVNLSWTGFNGLSVGGGHTCGVWFDGTANKILCWGGNWYGQLGLGNNLDQHSPAEVLGQN